MRYIFLFCFEYRKPKMTQIILTCFAGRRSNLEIVFRYTDVLVARGLLSELHLWNFCRVDSDEAWLREWFDEPRSSSNRAYIKLFHPVKAESWRDYYHHYTQERYPDHVIIKADDDVVFYDVDAFEGFIQRRLQNQTELYAFASIVNNGVAAHVQQQVGLIPPSFDLPYEPMYGRLWESGSLATSLQEYFIDNRAEWLSKARAMSGTLYRHPLGDRFSINLFAVLSKDLHTFQEIWWADDEGELTTRMPRVYNRQHYMDLAFTVAHLSFFRQRDTGLDEAYLQSRYMAIAP